MSMKSANEKRTVCEVLREINDILNGTELHSIILPKLCEAESMCKRMSKKLYKYNKEYDKDWWANNIDYEIDLKRRLNESYLT